MVLTLIDCQKVFTQKNICSLDTEKHTNDTKIPLLTKSTCAYLSLFEEVQRYLDIL